METLTYSSVWQLKYPIYVINTKEVTRVDGLLLDDNGLIIDDKNVKKQTLGARRLGTSMPNNLCKLNKSLSEFKDLLKIAKPSTVFIDFYGRVFRYEKTKSMPLVYYRVKGVELCNNHTKVWIKGFPSPFICQRPPPTKWIGIILVNELPWIFYEYSTTKKPRSRRKV